MRRAIVVLALFIGLVPRAGFTDERTAFSSAANLSRQGQDAQAVTHYLELARRSPTDTFADDALLEAARLYEEKLGQPVRAAETYERLVTEHPQSRLSMRAKRRAQFLREHMGPGGRDAEALAEYHRVLFEFAQRPRSESIARMAALVAKEPHFAGAPRAAFWLGSQYQKDGQLSEALATFRKIQTNWPQSEFAGRAKKAEGDVLLLRGDFGAADRVYRSLGQSGDVVDAYAAAQALRELRVAHWKARAYISAWVLCALFLLYMLISARYETGSWPRTWRVLGKPPLEFYYLLPVAALFVGAAMTEHYALGQAIEILAPGALVVTWLSGAVLEAVRNGRGRVSFLRALAHGAMASLAVLALSYIAIMHGGLLGMLIETVRFGAER